jgi:hypothetical protein
MAHATVFDVPPSQMDFKRESRSQASTPQMQGSTFSFSKTRYFRILMPSSTFIVSLLFLIHASSGIADPFRKPVYKGVIQ